MDVTQGGIPEYGLGRALTMLGCTFVLFTVFAACTSSSRSAGGAEDEGGGSSLAALYEKADGADEMHAALLLEDRFPSATQCRTCHPKQYREWSVSSHAYALLSPLFNSLQAAVRFLTNGTSGDFCIRCHTPVGMTIGEPLFVSALERSAIAQEGITCIACHRVSGAYGKVHGRRNLDEGSILDPVYGPKGGEETRRIIEDSEFGVTSEPGKTGRQIHADTPKSFQLTKPGFCGSCHDVYLPDGFRLEEAFSEFKNSAASARGETCQDCHMGKEQGVASGYEMGPAAVVGGKPTRVRRLKNHMFAGPDHSVIHPGLFPHNPEALEVASLKDWLSFDHEAGWGTDAFEDAIPDGYRFPDVWKDAEDRVDAREVVDAQLELLREHGGKRLEVLRNGYSLGEIEVRSADRSGITFEVDIGNRTDGHNVPTGFVAERLVYLHVTVTDAEGKVVMESGDKDPNGDLRDSHSVYVHNGEIEVDKQLFNLQSRFLVRMLRGGEREQILPINHSFDPLPFVRPPTSATVLKGRPRGVRLHKTSIPPHGVRTARYEVPRDALTGVGPYEVRMELMAGSLPVNLAAAMSVVGFDFGLSPRQIADRLVAGHLVLWKRKATIDVR
ncbi:MAG: cytochrome C [Planctomycetes bacterium]|nr:cytochrome C [Planctomycetota bacterium]